MALIRNSKLRPRILVVGGGYVGLITAQNLLKGLGRGEATVTVVDPNPYMTYAPFLPEVAAGSIEPRHAIVPLRRNLKGAEVITGYVRAINHDKKFATIEAEGDEPFELDYDQLVIAAGSVPRTLPIPGLAEEGIGLKRIEEAVAIRDHVLNQLSAAALMEDDEARRTALTFVNVGGGFAGVEALCEIEDMVRSAVAEHETLTEADVRFVLVEALDKIMPEVTPETAKWVVQHMRDRGIDVYLSTFLQDCTDKHVKLSSGEEFDADTILWSAGVKANPLLVDSDLPLDERGRLTVRADLRVEDEDGNVVADAWGAGDSCAVPDLSGMGPGGYCVPNAQHASRQAPVLAQNLLAALRGGTEFKQYFHKTIGSVAGLGLYKGASKLGDKNLKGFPAWLMHRLYHGYAIPTVDRKVKVFGNWILNAVVGRDVTPLKDADVPRKAFVEAAHSKPAPRKAPKDAPAAK